MGRSYCKGYNAMGPLVRIRSAYLVSWTSWSTAGEKSAGTALMRRWPPGLLTAFATGLLGCSCVFLVEFFLTVKGQGLSTAVIIVAAVTPALATWKIRSEILAIAIGALLGGVEWALLFFGAYWAYLSGLGGLEIESFFGDRERYAYVIGVLTAFMPVALIGGALLGFLGWASHDLLKQGHR